MSRYHGYFVDMLYAFYYCPTLSLLKLAQSLPQNLDVMVSDFRKLHNQYQCSENALVELRSFDND